MLPKLGPKLKLDHLCHAELNVTLCSEYTPRELQQLGQMDLLKIRPRLDDLQLGLTRQLPPTALQLLRRWRPCSAAVAAVSCCCAAGSC